MDDLIPMIKDAMTTPTDGFKIFASPWTVLPDERQQRLGWW